MNGENLKRVVPGKPRVVVSFFSPEPSLILSKFNRTLRVSEKRIYQLLPSRFIFRDRAAGKLLTLLKTFVSCFITLEDESLPLARVPKLFVNAVRRSVRVRTDLLEHQPFQNIVARRKLTRRKKMFPNIDTHRFASLNVAF